MDLWSGCLRRDRDQLCAVVEPGRRCSAYHPRAAQGERPAPDSGRSRLTGEHFRYPWQVHAYLIAAKIGNVLYQLPAIAVRSLSGPHQPAQLLRDRTQH